MTDESRLWPVLSVLVGNAMATAIVTEPVLDELGGWVATAQLHGSLDLARSTRGRLYCPSCSDSRKVRVQLLHHKEASNGPVPPFLEGASGSGRYYKGTRPVPKDSREAASYLLPSVWLVSCDQCPERFTATALIYEGPDGPALALFPRTRGGLSTRNTPPSVAYYLDQASRAQSVGAHTAAVSMFRGALDHLLYSQGYTRGMCGEKIAELEADIEAGKGPAWAASVDRGYLKVLKDLGNGALHTNDGEIGNQAALDNALVHAISAAFVEVLDVVYERPLKQAARQAMFEVASAALKGVKPQT